MPRRPSPKAQNFLNFMEFLESFAKSYVAATPTGNPGSTPAVYKVRIFCTKQWRIQNITEMGTPNLQRETTYDSKILHKIEKFWTVGGWGQARPKCHCIDLPLQSTTKTCITVLTILSVTLGVTKYLVYEIEYGVYV